MIRSELDWESIRLSPRDGFGVVGTLGFGDQRLTLMFLLKMVDYSRSFLLLSTGFFYRQVGGTILKLSYFMVGPYYFCVSPWHFDNGASSKIDDVLSEDGGLLQVLPLAVHLNFFLTDNQVGPFLFSELFCGTPPSCLKVIGGWGSGFELGWIGLGLGLRGFGINGLGLDNSRKKTRPDGRQGQALVYG